VKNGISIDFLRRPPATRGGRELVGSGGLRGWLLGHVGGEPLVGYLRVSFPEST
jgi:hypothetical protein